MKKINLPKFAVGLVLAAFSAATVADGVLGKVTAHGAVNVKSDSSNIEATIQDTTYSYFDKDQLITDKTSKAILELASDVGYVLIEPNSLASVDKAANSYNVSLEKGSLVFSFREGTDFNVTAAEKQIKPVFSNDFQLTGSGGKWVNGRISVDPENGDVEFQSISGEYIFSDSITNASEPVLAGETLLAQQSQLPTVMKTQAGSGDSANGENYTPEAVFAVALLIALISDSDGDDDDPPQMIDEMPEEMMDTPTTPTGGATGGGGTTTGGGGGGGGGRPAPAPTPVAPTPVAPAPPTPTPVPPPSAS